MFVGICSVDIHIPWACSLKDKRQELKGIIDKLKNRFNVSVAEVAAQDFWQHAVLGISTVSASADLARQTLQKAVDYIEENANVEVVDFNIEVL